LAEAFYTALQALEICFRNTIAGQLGTRFGTDWFQNGRPSFRNDAVRSIADAANNLRLSRKPVAVDPLIAELSFGFWVSLLGPRYDATLWRQTLYAGFSRSSKPISRSIVHGRFNALRRFRNRVAHHEPIFHDDLQLRHDEIIDAIAWMSDETAKWAAGCSRFSDVFAAP
jgi:hypothetical protein